MAVIQILNAPAGHCNAVGLKRAMRLVKRGRATWNADQTGILAAHALRNAEQIEAELAERRRRDRTGETYDRVNRMMTMEEVCNPHFPCVGNGAKMFHGRKAATA